MILDSYFPDKGIEIITCILKNNVWASTVAICHAIDEISKCIKDPKPNEKMKRSIDLKLRNILIQVQDLDRYVYSLENMCQIYFAIIPFNIHD